MPAPTPPDPAVVGINTLLESDLPDSVANYDSLAAFAARTETDIEDELNGTEQTRFGRIFTGFFSGLPTGKPFIAALIQSIIHKSFPGTTTQYSTATAAMSALETKFTDKWNNLSGIVAGTADTLLGTTTDGTLQSASAALQNTYNTVQGLASDVAAIKTRNNAAAAGGKNYTVDFSKYPERFLSGAQSGSFPEYPSNASADFTLTYSGAGTGSLSILDGKAHWTAGSGARTVFAVYRDKTDTDYQLLTGTIASPMSAGGAQNWILGRCNSAGDTFVYAYGYSNSLLDFRAELGCYVNGVKTVFATNVAAQPNFNLALRIGDTAGVRHFQVMSGNKVIIDYTDSANVSQYGSSYRYWGFQSVANGASVPADAVQVAGADAPLNSADAGSPLSTSVQNALSTKEPTITAGTTAQYWRGDKSWQTLNAAAVSGAEATANKGNANGYASLDSAGKVPVSQLPNSIMEYQGTWNASTNTPTLADGTGSAGDVYRVSAAASRNLGSGSIDFAVGDYVIYSGSVWEKADCTDAVASVNGYTGTITLTKSDVGLANADDTSDATKNAAVAALTNKDLTSATNTFPTLNQNTTGSAATLTTARTVQTNLASTSSASFDGSANITPGVTGTLPVANGGTGAATLAANNVLLGNGTSELQAVSPGTSGNVLTSNGTTWSSTAPAVTLTNSVTLTNKTLTSPRISVINDANGNTGAWVGGTASAVNFLQLSNAATGNRALLRAQGETNVGLGIAPRGTGTVALQDGNFAYVLDAFGVSSSVNYLNVSNAATGNAPYIQSTGTDTNVNLNLRTRGSGVVQLNGVSAVDISTAQVLTNKDLSSATNTFPTFNQNTTGSSAKWTTARTLAGNSVDGSANVSFANKFVVQGTSDSGLSGAQFLGALSTGIVKNTTSTGVLSIAAAGTDYLAPGGALGTPSSGTLTSCSGLPLSGVTSSTSTALGVGSLEVGHASDTTLARSAAGVITVEGVEISRRTVQTVTGTTTLGSNGDYMVFIGASGAPTLPTAVGNTGRYTVKNIDTANRTIATTSSQTIEGVASPYTLLPNASVDLFSDGSNWRIV